MMASSFLISFYFISGTIIIFLAGTILRHSEKSVVSWATALVLIFAGFGPVLSAISLILEQSFTNGTLVLRNLSLSFNYVWEFFFPSLLLFALVYPKRFRWWGRIRKLVCILYIPHFFHLALMIFFEDKAPGSHITQLVSRISLPSEVLQSMLVRCCEIADIVLGLFLKAHMQLFSIVNIFFATVALFMLFHSLRTDIPPRVRRQLKVVLIGLGLCVINYSWARFIPLIAGLNIDSNTSMLFINLSLIIGGGSIGYAVVRLQFLGVRVIARKGIIYAATAAILASVYLVTVRQITGFLYSFAGARADILDTAIIVIFIIMFQPVLSRVEEWSEKMLIGEGKTQRARVRRLMNELLSVIDESDLKAKVVPVVSEAFSIERVELWTKGDMEFERASTATEVMELLVSIGEPMKRNDFLEAVRHRGVKRRVHGLGGDTDRDDVSYVTGKLSSYDMIVPIVDANKCIALLLMGESSGRRKFSSEEFELLSMLSAQIASSLNNISLLEEVLEKKLMEEELSIARAIQLNLLPSRPPELDRYELFATSRSSKFVGGDYYDFIHREDMLAIAVADVSGKGVPASLLMASLQASLRGAMNVMDRPVEVVRKLNEAMFSSTSSDRFATLFYGCLDMSNDMLKYTNAGHLFPVVLKGGSKLEVLDYSGLILGVKPDFEYQEKAIEMAPGDMLVVVTDGVTEADDSKGDYFGERRLYDILLGSRDLGAQEVVERIFSSVTDFASGNGLSDDITILVLKRLK